MMIHSFTALMLSNTLFVIICPIIALMDDQFQKVNNEYRVPAAKVHGELPLQYKHRVLVEVAKKHIKILFVTAESFMQNQNA